MNQTLRVLCIGDIVGSSGREELKRNLKAIKDSEKIDLTIVNAENACGGMGLDTKRAYEIRDMGVDVITLGDHTWDQKDLLPLLETNPKWIVRPDNYPQGAPGLGVTSIDVSGIKVAVGSFIGRVFMNGSSDCPFNSANKHVSRLEEEGIKIRIFDFHAEATSEKIAFGRYLDGKASLIFGTHTHVQTADEKVMVGGTAFISDLGMSGSTEGVIGMKTEIALYRFLTGRPKFYEAAKGHSKLSGIVCEIEIQTGRALSIDRLKYLPQL